MAIAALWIKATPWKATHSASIAGADVIPLSATPHALTIGARTTTHVMFELGEDEPSWGMFEDGSISRLRETVGGHAIPIHAESHGVIAEREGR